MTFCKDMESKTSEELLLEYKQTRDHKIKQEIVLRYVTVVRRIAIKMKDVYSGFAQTEDIVNEGVIALMKAIDKYDIDKNVKFDTYI
ncbi:MAG: sigma factor, partial [Proteocatella sp.]